MLKNSLPPGFSWGWRLILSSVRHRRSAGFTLAELLTVIAVLGVISSFTIPKILTAQNHKQWNAEAREAASAISNAYQTYKLTNTSSASTNSTDLMQYFNAAKVKTSGLIDDTVGDSSMDCAVVSCVLLHNGSVVWADPNSSFSGTSNLNAVILYFDADGVYGGGTIGDSKAVGFILYYNGRLADVSTMISGTILFGTVFNTTQLEP